MKNLYRTGEVAVALLAVIVKATPARKTAAPNVTYTRDVASILFNS